MRLLPNFFLALFSTSVLWAQSPPVWTPPQLAATPTPADAAATPEPTPEQNIAGNPASQQDPQPTPSPVAAIESPHSDLFSTLANRQDQPVTLTIDEAAGV